MYTTLSYLTSFILPVTSLGFLTTGPHSITEALLWTLPFCCVLLLDWKGPAYRPHREAHLSNRCYVALLYALAIVQFINIALLLHTVSLMHWDSQATIITNLVNLVVIRFVIGASSGTAIVLAHELIHRPQRHLQVLSGLVLCSVCYEHFRIAHIRGHHSSITSLDDIATARLGENFNAYWRRAYPGHFRYAWQSELTRLAVTDAPWRVSALARNRVFKGLLFEMCLLLFIIALFDWLAALVFLYQAYVAIRINEAINYVQHWGLQEGHYGNSYGWVCHSWITLYSLIGLSNHIGHHRDENQPFYAIAYSDQGPTMPYGYFVMNLWSKLDNASYQKMAVAELERFQQRRKGQGAIAK